MITDSFYKMIEVWKRELCHHEYVRKRYYSDFYECRKCGRRVYNPPKELVVHDDC